MICLYLVSYCDMILHYESQTHLPHYIATKDTRSPLHSLLLMHSLHASQIYLCTSLVLYQSVLHLVHCAGVTTTPHVKLNFLIVPQIVLHNLPYSYKGQLVSMR